MVTSTVKVTCPYCHKSNDYEVQKLELVDTDLHATYVCNACGNAFTDVYALVYVGGIVAGTEYDRDGLVVKR